MSTIKYIIQFFGSLNGVFAPKSPMDNPAFAEMYADIMDISSPNNESIKKSLRGDMARFGADFKKATAMAKEMLNVQ